LRISTEGFKFVRPDVGPILLFKAVDLDGAIILLEEDDRPRAAGLSFPGTGNALFDNPSTKIGADHALVREAGGVHRSASVMRAFPAKRANGLVL